MTLQPASGARDLNPQQVRKNHLIASKLSSLYQLWGYERISPPHIERLDTLMAAGGISNNEIAETLHINKGDPVVILNRHSYAKDKGLVEFRITTGRADMFSYTTTIGNPDA